MFVWRSWPCHVHVCVPEAQTVLLECLTVGSCLVKYSVKSKFSPDIWQKCFCDNNRFTFLALKWSSWVIIKISHAHIPAVGREQGTFVFSNAEGTHSVPKSNLKFFLWFDTNSLQTREFYQVCGCEEECSWIWWKSEKPQLFSEMGGGLRLVAEPPPVSCWIQLVQMWRIFSGCSGAFRE